MSSRSSVDKAPVRSSGGHELDSCRGQIFLCLMLVSCRLTHVSPWYVVGKYKGQGVSNVKISKGKTGISRAIWNRPRALRGHVTSFL